MAWLAPPPNALVRPIRGSGSRGLWEDVRGAALASREGNDAGDKEKLGGGAGLAAFHGEEDDYFATASSTDVTGRAWTKPSLLSGRVTHSWSPSWTVWPAPYRTPWES